MSDQANKGFDKAALEAKEQWKAELNKAAAFLDQEAADAKEVLAKARPGDKAAATAHYEERAAHASEFKEARANNDKEAAAAMTYYEELTKKLNMWTRADKP